MKPPDDLCELWQSDPGSGGLNERELMLQLKQRRRTFDRMIRGRDLRESVAGLVVTVLFVGFALRGGSAMNLAADVWLASCGLWIVFYLRRYSRLSRTPPPDQSLASYRAELLERYNRQIRLLKHAKYWYVLPFWVGLMIHAASLLTDGRHWVPFLAMSTFVTVVNAGVWWLNEGPGVRNLERRRQELAMYLGEDGVSK
jgi:hypothetical protein